MHKGADSEMQWPPEVLPYLLDEDLILNSNLAVMGDVKIVATAVNPLSGLQTISGHRSAILGHAQVAMEMVATPHNKLPKMLHTTGSVSRKNYGRSKTGKKAEHHHTLGAVYVETQGKYFWPRELIADSSGTFYDLDIRYTREGYTTGHPVSGLVLGDEHVKWSDAAVLKATFEGKGSLCGTVKPEALVRHDIHDHYSGSHHHLGNHLLQLAKHIKADDIVEEELQLSADHVNHTSPPNCINYIIESNHHDHLAQWLNKTDPKRDLKNAAFYYKLMGKAVEAIEKGDHRSVFELWMADNLQAPYKFINANDELLIEGIDCSQHGHIGANGARAGKRSFANASYKMIAGHSHSPCIEKGFYQVGTSTMKMGYAKGLSSWMVTHAIIYPNGKRSLIHIINGKWRSQT